MATKKSKKADVPNIDEVAAICSDRIRTARDCFANDVVVRGCLSMFDTAVTSLKNFELRDALWSIGRAIAYADSCGRFELAHHARRAHDAIKRLDFFHSCFNRYNVKLFD